MRISIAETGFSSGSLRPLSRPETRHFWLIVPICAVLTGCPAGSPEGEAQTGWSEVAPLPAPVSNNAVAAVSAGGRDLVLSVLGVDTTRHYSGIHDRAFLYDLTTNRWEEVQGPGIGRLAGTAEAVRGRIYLFSGYTVAADGSERTLPDVDIFDAQSGTWSSGAPIPVPADDAVSGVWRDSLIFLISGWRDRDNVTDVQIYDPFTDSWQAATPIPGPAVFGHAGAIAGDAIVYIDGVRTAADQPRFRLTAASYIGRIDPSEPTRIEWQQLPQHPGPTLYRAAAGAVGDRVIFAGGTDNPYNYDGIGYNGEPSEPVGAVFAFNMSTEEWEPMAAKPLPSMDHRGVAVAAGRLFIVGGMLAGQRVTARVQMLEPAGGAR